MARDPAFLFYSQDFYTGTATLSFEDKGKYITLLCLMHQQGRMKEETIRFLVGSISDNLKLKFRIDDDGLWYNERLEAEAEARMKFTESRRLNGIKGGRPLNNKPNGKPINNLKDMHMGNHMEDVNENVNENINKDKGGVGEKEKPKKIKYSEDVLMTVEEYEKLCTDYGEGFTKQCIEVLDNYKGSSGRKYKNDYRAILSWVVDKIKKQNQNGTSQKSLSTTIPVNTGQRMGKF